jgi:hypothetical protein
MTSRDFCFWLQGMFELGQPKALNEATTKAIRKHLELVFVHEIDPSMGPPEHQAKLNDVHKPSLTAEDIEEALKEGAKAAKASAKKYAGMSSCGAGKGLVMRC